MRYTNLITVTVSVILAACASAPSGAAPADARVSAGAVSGTNTNIITAAQLAQADLPTVYDAIDRLHHSWFHDTSAGASGSVFVYLDSNELTGGAAALRQIPAHEIAEIQYLKSADAIARFGQRAIGGAIIVTRK